MSFIGLFSSFLGIMAVDSNCDYFSDMTYGDTKYVFNAEYPNSYRPGASCRWVAVSPPNTKIQMECVDINIPWSEQCYYDNLKVSLTGNVDLTDGHRYCGQGTLQLISNSNRISIALNSNWYSSGGRFSCTIKTVGAPQPSCECGWRQQRRIVGGHDVGVNEYPSMVGLLDIDNVFVFCGGSIISKRYVLTAAHCTTIKSLDKVGLLVGDHDISTGSDTTAAALHRAQSVIVHENYNAATFENDIAIYKTQQNIVFSIDVGPICLPFNYVRSNFDGADITVLGWGLLEFAGPTPTVLQGVTLQAMSNAVCKTKTTDTVLDNNICLFSSGKDSCQRDSGGPCIYYNTSSKRNYLIGLVSHGLGCASSRPSINTRVTSFLNWIVQKTPDAEYCMG